VTDRADPSVFQLPVKKIRSGYYSDAYFNFTKSVLEHQPGGGPDVVMQVFQKNEAVLGGIDEAIAVLKLCSGYQPEMIDEPVPWRNGWDKLKVRALREGDEISPFEPVMTIEGPYRLFAHLETVYLGTLARRTLIGTNVRRVIRAANGKPILYFPARHDHWQVQTGDGYAAYCAGAEGVSTDAQANWWGGRGMGTAPHGLIAAFGGDTAAATVAFAKQYGHSMNISALVDFDNNCAMTALRVAKAMQDAGHTLWGVRLDTSESLVDEGLWPKMGQFKPTGVVPELVWHVRKALDQAGHEDVKIIVSGGFTADKISRFEAEGVPVDAYGVGASLIRGGNDFTADVVLRWENVQPAGWKPCGKVGRTYIHSDRLEVVE
jgi:nicotinate phosphoribosyltransferase